jgi:hypothetical protein
MTVFVAILAIFVLPDFPTTPCSWLTAEEQALAQLRMEEDVGVDNREEMDSKGEKSGLKQALSDWKVWWLALASMSMMILLSFSAFFPTLSATLGYGPTVSLLLCTPPWMFATCVAFLMPRQTIIWFYYESLLTATKDILIKQASALATLLYYYSSESRGF